ncbi:MAG: gamma-glutamyltransferase [Alphaproteobacteria bacterium]
MASLGGGGGCLVFDARLGRIEAVDFMPRSAASPTPMNARGFFVMQGRYGRTRWEQLVGPAEGLARFGHPVSRALARDLAENAGAVSASPELSRLLMRGGSPLREGDQLVQPALADTLAQSRGRGAKEFHESEDARRFVDAARAAGARFTQEEFAAAAPQVRAPLSVSIRETRVAFLPPASTAGIFQAQLWQMLAQRWPDASRDEQANLLVEAQKRALADAQRWGALDLSDFAAVTEAISPRRAQALMADYRPGQASTAIPPAAPPESAATATFVAVDVEGGAAACAVSAGAPFGSGRVAGGVVLAAPSAGVASPGVASLSAMMAIRSISGRASLSARADSEQFVFAGASGGGRGSAASLVAVGLSAVVRRESLGDLVDRPRLLVPGGGAEVLGEPGAVARGHQVVEATALGRINAVSCPAGIVDEPTACRVRHDQRGNGLAVGGVR